MIIQRDNLATIHDILGNREKAAAYREGAREIADRLNAYAWDEDDGIYYDLHVDGTKMTWKSIAAFWPMLAGVTTPRQDSALVRHLLDTAAFWRDMPFSTLAATHREYRRDGGYWLGAVWAPTNHAVIKGIERVGRDDVAHAATARYLEALYQVYLQTGTLWENYAADKIDGRFKQGINDRTPPSDCRRDFVGWTGLGPISLLVENLLGFRVDAPGKRLTHDIRRLDRHGIENLHFAGITTSIIVADRHDAPSTARLTVTTDKPYTLVIHLDGKTFTRRVRPGTRTIVVK
jgi:neutral trehalase